MIILWTTARQPHSPCSSAQNTRHRSTLQRMKDHHKQNFERHEQMTDFTRGKDNLGDVEDTPICLFSIRTSGAVFSGLYMLSHFERRN
jgi:hypothetical protein